MFKKVRAPSVRPLLLIAPLIFLLAGCASRPDEELASAQASIDAAFDSEAPVYASRAYNEAFDLLLAGQRMAGVMGGKTSFFKHYGEARELLLKAKSKAETAKKLAADNKAKAAQEARGMLDRIRKTVLLIRESGFRTPESETILEDVDHRLAEAEQSLREGRYMLARKQSQSALKRLGPLQGNK